MINREQVGVRIAALRKKAGLSQASLAEKLCVSAQAVSKWESGKNLPDIDVFLELAWLFNTTIDSIADTTLSFESKPERIILPPNVMALISNSETQLLLESLSPYCSDNELCSLAKEFSKGNLRFSLSATLEKWDEQLVKTISIPPESLTEHTLRETAPYFAKVFGGILGEVDPGLCRAADLLRCPVCGEKLTLHTQDNKELSFICENNHCYPVIDGVVDFGTREIPGEMWSLFFKNYNDYLREQQSPGNPRYQQGTVSCREVRWQELKKRRPRVILDIASGTGSGIKYDLQRINWPCLVIMTDLSHRVLKYNKRYFSEELVNPYVDIVYLACDCAALPLADHTVDTVVSTAGFESMQLKMPDGFREGYRILKPGGTAVYNMSLLEDRDSANTQKWLKLCHTIPDFTSFCGELYDLPSWQNLCSRVGYSCTETRKIYGELPAPDTDVFPFQNEVLQWMGTTLCVSVK